MKQYLCGFIMCQSMFCAIPCPLRIWDDQARDKMLVFLPVVGLEIGILWAILGWLLQRVGVGAIVQGALLCVFPFVVTGFIHLDGYLDVTDAVKSCRDLSKRREILKDSHVGAFAVIGCVLLMMTQFAFCTELEDDVRILLWIPVVSRCCSALAVGLLKPMSTSQYSGQRMTKGQITVLLGILVAVMLVGCLMHGWQAVSLLGVLAGYGLALRRGFSSLQGMNGDISGYALTIGELCGLGVLVII